MPQHGGEIMSSTCMRLEQFKDLPSDDTGTVFVVHKKKLKNMR